VKQGKDDVHAAQDVRSGGRQGGQRSAAELDRELTAPQAVGGDLGNLDAIAKILDEQGYRLDTRCLQNLPDHPLSQREAFVKAVRQSTPTAQQKPDKAVER